MGQVERYAAEQQSRQVEKIVLQIGPLAGVEPRLLQEAFSIARAGTIAAEAELQIDALPLKVRCLECGEESSAIPNRLLCAACGDWRTQVISGDEMLLARIELLR